jgi:lipopolysaccharide transport system permease protein
VPWTYFVTVLTQSTTSVVKNQTVITKIYFPRLIIPMSAVFIGLLDFFIAFVILFVMMLFYGVVPTAAVWTLPLFVLLAIMTALGIGLWLAALNVRYRDVGFILPFLTQIWLFATPVVYPSGLVPGRWQVLYGVNPMAGVVEGFRWALLGKSHAPDMILIPSVLVATVVLIGGFYFFRHREHTFADEV